MQSTTFRALASTIFAAIDADTAPALRALEALEEKVDALEARASRFRTDSELVRLNARSGERVRVSSELWQEIATAVAMARWTSGLVTPTVLPLLEHAGYDRTFDELADRVLDTPNRPAPPVCDARAIILHANSSSVELPAHARLDLGGTAKGHAADVFAGELGGMGPSLVDVGGDIAVSGPRADGTPWPIDVQDPHDPERSLALVALGSGGVATSGRDFRRWRTTNGEAHHIVDPRTGRPAHSDVIAATVVARSALRAEVAAKVVVLLGSRAGLDWLGTEPDLAALVVLENAEVHTCPRFSGHLWSD